MTTTTETRTPPPPTYPHHVYGVNLTWIGEEGEMMAEGHVPLVRFIAACNHMARKDAGLRNLMDWSKATLEDALDGVRHAWALPVDYSRDNTAETPGAIPVTLWEP